MIECKDVSIVYGKRKIIDKISLRAESGKITVILGKNGCGKTTLLRAVSGYLGYSGSIKADDLEVKKLSISQRSKCISVMPQMFRKPDITVRELVSFGRQPYTGITGILSESDWKAVESVIEKTGLAPIKDKRLNCISGGECQKAYFAMLLSQNTPNLILDEPGSHLDARYANSLMEFLKEEKKNGKAILAVFHDINRTIEAADKIIVIQDSRAIFEGSSQEFCESSIAEDVFGLKKYICKDADNPSEKKCCYL